MTSQTAEVTARPSAARVLVILLIAAVAVMAVRAFLVQSFVIPSGSMSPTLEPGERVLATPLGAGDLRRGDVIVFDGAGVFAPSPPPARNALVAAGRAVASAVGVPVGRSDFVKRVIGLPGERVTCCDGQGRITVDGVALTEPYVAPGEAPSMIRFDVRVPAERLWVMGDHRSDSADSRAHLGDPGGGMVPVDHVVGRVVSVWWPLDRMSSVSRGQPREGTQ